MPDTNSVASLYPQPPQPTQPNALTSNPLAMINALSDIQKYQYLQQAMPALAQQPAATLQGTQIANATAQMQQDNQARAMVASTFGTVLSGMKNPSQSDVDNLTTYVARSHPTIDPSFINSAADVVLNDPGGIKSGASKLVNGGLSPFEASQRVTGPPNPDGSPTTVPITQANTAGPMTTGMPPGFMERQTGGAQLDTQVAGNLAQAAEGSPARRGILGNLDQLVGQFTPGPGADWTKVAKSFINRNVPLPSGWQFSPSSIASQEEFNKQATQLAQSQFQTIGGTGTDSKFASAFQTSPNDALSTMGNQGIIRLLKGNEDALQAKNTAWLTASAANPNLSYRQFSQQFTQNFDPRAYQFTYMSPTERQSYFAGMNKSEQDRFLGAVAYARKNHYVNY